MTCYLVFSEPGHVFNSVHRTLDGATHEAASMGAATMPDGNAITIALVRAQLANGPRAVLMCDAGGSADAIHIERHAIVV